MKTPLTKNLIIKHVGESAVTFGNEYPYPAARPIILKAIQGPSEPPTLLCWTGNGYERLMPIADISDPTNITGCALKFDWTLDYIDVYRIASIDPNRIEVSDGKLIGAEFAYEGRADVNDTQSLLLSFGSEGGGGGTEVVPNPEVDENSPTLTSIGIGGTGYKIEGGGLKVYDYTLTTQEESSLGNASYSNPITINLNDDMRNYDAVRIWLSSGMYFVLYRSVRIAYEAGLMFSNHIPMSLFFDGVAGESTPDLEITLTNAGIEGRFESHIFKAEAIQRYYAIQISSIRINEFDYTLRAIVDANAVDIALQSSSMTMYDLQTNFQTLAQADPTTFARLLLQLCNGGFEFGRPCYLASSVDNFVLSCTVISGDAIGFGSGSGGTGTGLSISMASSAIPTEFANATLLYSTKWLSNFGTLYN